MKQATTNKSHRYFIRQIATALVVICLLFLFACSISAQDRFRLYESIRNFATAFCCIYIKEKNGVLCLDKIKKT